MPPRRQNLEHTRLRERCLSSDAKCNTPADLISARLFKTLRSVAMRSYSHLSEDERDQIGVLRAAGRSMGAIARALGRAKTTISRELQRNALPSGRYSPLHAACAIDRLRRREAANTRPRGERSAVAPWRWWLSPDRAPGQWRPSTAPQPAKCRFGLFRRPRDANRIAWQHSLRS